MLRLAGRERVLWARRCASSLLCLAAVTAGGASAQNLRVPVTKPRGEP